MSFPGLRSLAFVCLAAVLAAVLAASPAAAQAPTDAKANEQQKAEASKKTEAAHLAEVARLVKGPAGFPECAHLGENAVSLMMRNDIDTAWRHIDLFDRFGCPFAHVQTSFRCVLLKGMPVAKDGPSLEDIVRACWIDPSTTSVTPAAAVPAAAAAAATQGTGAH